MPSIASLTVPQRAKPVLRWLGSLEPSIADAVLATLDSTEEFRSTQELTRRLSAVDGIEEIDAEQFVAVLFTLSALHYSHGWPVADMTETIAEMDSVEIPEGLRPQFGERFAFALTAKAVVGLAKAVDVAYEHDHLFHTVRILSDIRPVFGDEPAGGALGAVVTHTLRLDYYDRQGLATFSTAMTDSELDELEAAVSRAKQKREVIRDLMSDAHLIGFETASED